ncbi:MAG: VanZ family protein [Anaerolineaceae bacterium]|nr:MAG: VanZ family protein [Anaerolineaceae bacterium]
MRRKILPWTLVILWMALIFFFSHQPGTESNELSSGITRSIAEVIKWITPGTSPNQGTLNYIIRKGAHFSIYLVLGLLVTNGLLYTNKPKLKVILLTLLICVLYAISDEIHQLFISGRSGQITDVLIDSTGGLVGTLLMSAIRRK